MDIAFDSTWCPVCSRQILPKRYYVPINPQPQAPAPPPSSPTSDSKDHTDAPAPRLPRTKTGTIRAKGGGLVHGTGRVKPNGGIKRDNTVKDNAKKATQQAGGAEASPVRPAGPVRHRTVIDQSPVPLYCSDECRLADLQSTHSAIGLNYNPERCASPTLPPVPHNSLSDFSDESESAASVDSRSSTASSPPPSESTTDSFTSRAQKGYARLAQLYDMPPLPPPPPIQRKESSSSEASPQDYQSGVMMAAQRIKAALCSEPPKRSAFDCTASYARTTERKPIPGWTDGSHAWRASVYSFAAPSDKSSPSGGQDGMGRAYKSFVASSHRSGGVYSTMSDTKLTSDTASASVPAMPLTTTPAPPSRSQSAAEELYSKYSLTFARRTDSRAPSGLSTSPTGSARSLPVTAPSSAPRRKEFSLLKPGAEGRLLVPNVKMSRASSATTVSSEGASSCSSYYGGGGYSGYYGGDRRRSPLSRQNSDASMETAQSESTSVGDEGDETIRGPPASLPTHRRAPQPPLWSYSDDTLTYPMLQLPLKEKRIEKRIVDGVEREVEVEVEVKRPVKRLFLFPGRDTR
ncbi:hypothetical protein AcV5_007669 [Taiwanofungus camphoratus]|nr:hypothetical protein AcV5_007669 [Antrodia cinnamomea]